MIQATSAPGRVLERPSAAEPIVQLGRAAFEDAVQQALKVVLDPLRLAQSPLVHSRLVWLRADRASAPCDRVAVLAARLREGIAELARVPGVAHTERVLTATWLEPNDGQKVVADRLGLAFGTYRHHLREGTASLAEQLWSLETAS